MIMDTFAAIGIATEPPIKDNHHKHDGKEVHNESKRKKNDNIIQAVMWRNILTQAGYQILVLLVILYSAPFWFENSSYNLVNTDFYAYGDASHNIKQHFTILFNTFVIMNLCYKITCRKLDWSDIHIYENILNNKWFLFVTAVEFGAQWLIVEFPLFNTIFRTVPLALNMHITCWMFGLGAIAVNIAAKKIFNNSKVHYKIFNVPFNEKNDKENYSKVLKLFEVFKSKYQSKPDEIDRILEDYKRA
jgi:magnesium-transporting ATPase (P-type)